MRDIVRECDITEGKGALHQLVAGLESDLRNMPAIVNGDFASGYQSGIHFALAQVRDMLAAVYLTDTEWDTYWNSGACQFPKEF